MDTLKKPTNKSFLPINSMALNLSNKNNYQSKLDNRIQPDVELKIRLPVAENLPKNPNSTWRGNIYKCTSIADYSRSFASNESQSQKQICDYLSRTPYLLATDDIKNSSISESSKKNSGSLPPLTSGNIIELNNTKSNNKCQIPNRTLLGKIQNEIYRDFFNTLSPIEEYMNSLDLHIQQLSIKPIVKKNPIRILNYARNNSNNSKNRNISSVNYNKRNISIYKRNEDKKINDCNKNPFKKSNEIAYQTTKRYSQSPSTNLSTIREKNELKKKVPLNKTFNENYTTPPIIPKRNKARIRHIRKDVPISAPIIERLKQKSKPVFFSDDPYTFVITFGNNSQIIRRCIEKRPDWKEAPEFTSIFDFKWQPFSKGFRFDQISISKKQMINHFENHFEITTKDWLFRNLLIYSEHIKRNVFDYVPLTFLLDMDSETFSFDFDRFVHCYKVIDSAKKNEDQKMALKIMNQKLLEFPILKDNKSINQSKFKLDEASYSGKNIWILKPTGFNRGRGISVFDSIDKLKTLIRYYSEGVLENIGTDAEANAEVTLQSYEQIRCSISNINNLPSIIKSRTFVIQKYIERPLLFHERKFDIRVWVLITQEMKVYFFKEGYLRLSSEKYTTDDNAIDRKNIHLTNNAIQKYCEGYGIFEDGNQVSFSKFQVLIFVIIRNI